MKDLRTWVLCGWALCGWALCGLALGACGSKEEPAAEKGTAGSEAAKPSGTPVPADKKEPAAGKKEGGGEEAPGKESEGPGDGDDRSAGVEDDKGAQDEEAGAAEDDDEEGDAPEEGFDTGLPPLTKGSLSAQAYHRSDKANKEGLGLHKKGDHKGASRRYEEAIGLDPGFVTARYNLACARALLGNKDGALAILKELKAGSDCSLCKGMVLQAARDKDFKGLWEDKDFKAVLDGVQLPEADLEQVARAVEVAFLKGEPEAMDPFLTSRGRIRVNNTCSRCDEEDADNFKTHDRSSLRALFQQLQRAKKQEGLNLEGFWKMKCQGDCCSSPSDRPLLHNTDFLDQVCVRKRAGVYVITSIKIVGG